MLQTAADLSIVQVQKIISIIRSWLGRHVFEPNLLPQLRERDHMVKDFFLVSHREMDSTHKDEKDKVDRATFHCNNIASFVSFVLLKRRQCQAEFVNKLGLEGGGGSVKLCLNLVSKGSSSTPSTKKGKFSYQDGLLQKGFSDGGVEKLFILGLVEQVTESAHNLKLLLEFADIHKISFVQAMDIKCINVCVGLGLGSSTCPCPFCSLAKKFFKDLSNISSSELRTIGSIKEWAAKYKAAAETHLQKTGKKLSSKEFFSCERDPLLDLPDNTLILDAIVPPELHLFTGIFTHIFDCLNKKQQKLPGCNITAFDWSDAMSIHQSGRQGGNLMEIMSKNC